MKSLIIVGPSGVGKGTVISQLLKKYSIFEFVVSFTTRHPRPGEIEGKDYYFISHQEFNQRKENGEMLENKKVFTNYYGTSRSCYFEIIKRGRIPLLDVDIEGMKDIRMRLREEKQKEEIVEVPEVLCLMPPSWKILEERLSKRGTQQREVFAQRMQENRQQISTLMHLKEEKLHFITNYQYQLTVFGIELFLAANFSRFREIYWKRNLDFPGSSKQQQK